VFVFVILTQNKKVFCSSTAECFPYNVGILRRRRAASRKNVRSAKRLNRLMMTRAHVPRHLATTFEAVEQLGLRYTYTIEY
jgi:hypothetical protein